MILIQEALRSGAALEPLLEKYHLHAKRHEEFPNLILFKYDQLDSPLGDPLVQQCRGIILDEKDNWNVVCRSFDKFFNYGEGHAAPIDWTTARVEEKLDGSLCNLYFYEGAWRVATSGTPDASGEVGAHGFTFKDLFWRVFAEKGYQTPIVGHRHITFMFELTTPYNRVVVQHKGNDLRLIGLRSINDGHEIRPDATATFEHVRSFPLGTLDDVLATLPHIDPITQEGYVVVDAQFHRQKVKAPAYVALHHAINGFGPRRLLEVVRGVESEELLTYFPEWTDALLELQAKYEDLITEIDTTYTAWKWAPDQKTFALGVKDYPFSGVLFALRKGSISSIKEGLKEMHIDKLMALLGMKDV